MERALEHLLPAREYMLTHAPDWWDEVGMGKWSSLHGDEKQEWWRWTVKIDIASEANVAREVPLRALGAYTKKNALDDPFGPGWRQNSNAPDTWEWPFRFKDYWNENLRLQLEAIVAAPRTTFSPLWIQAARNRLRLCAERYQEQQAAEQRRLKELKKRARAYELERDDRANARLRAEQRRDLPERRIRRGQIPSMLVDLVDEINAEFNRDDTE